MIMRAKQFLLLCAMLLSVFYYSQNTDVWDFGAKQLDPTTYNNQLSEATINSWYDASITPGSLGINFPSSFTAGILSWTGGTNDRLRTTNENLTRYDANIANVVNYSGRVYCNATAPLTNGVPTSRFFTMNLNEDDEIKIIARGDTAGQLNFVYAANASLQSDSAPTTTTSGSITEVSFVAKASGNYRIYDSTAKASIYRIYRKAAVYTTVSGTIDTSQAPLIPSGYTVIFTNQAGKSWTATVNAGSYSVNLPAGYNYTVSLGNANGFVISSGENLTTVGATSTTTHHISVLGVALYQVTGNISGLGSAITNLSGLQFTPDPNSGTVYNPNPSINTTNSTYSVSLESGIEYTISANGVNDYEITPNTLTIAAQNSTHDINFIEKTKYPIAITTSGLNSTELSSLQLTFNNLNESGYSYPFSDLSTISLRNGTYKISSSGLDQFPVEQVLTSNLIVNNSTVSKNLIFKPVTVWSFDDKAINTTTTAYYKGMQLNGQITTVTNSGHLTAKPGATILVPVNVGEKVIVSYYYSANFSIEGGSTISTNSGSTSLVETTQYAYTGTVPGNVTISVGGLSGSTSYFTEIKTVPNVQYASIITVGSGKDYATINEALNAITNMVRPNSERVTVEIDPGNYEEMLVINQPNITLKNASSNPSTDLNNNGVGIASNAVRITSYYGHGYNYYSMANNQKWNQDILDVNLANGNYSYTNAGSGTTNGSYWNATVVVSANGFEAEHIIFENSFNQYISTKESQDVVVPWTSGSPGARTTTFGNTFVQNKTLVERAAAIAFANNTDKAILNQCRVVGRQDTFFGGVGSRVVVFKGSVMGAIDFIFGGMTAVFYKTDLVMNTSNQSNDLSYITAAQQSSGRGYLMYECKITSTNPGINTASTYRSKPGYFGRPWQPNTSEVVFYNTTIETSDFPGFVGNSLILPLGWNNSLNGTSPGMYEYGTIELSGVNNSGSRASWATFLTSPTLTDGTAITTFNFTKGNDNWDPIPDLEEETLGSTQTSLNKNIKIYAVNNQIFINNKGEKTQIKIYGMNGMLVKQKDVKESGFFTMPSGIWIVTASAANGRQSVKVITK